MTPIEQLAFDIREVEDKVNSLGCGLSIVLTADTFPALVANKIAQTLGIDEKATLEICKAGFVKEILTTQGPIEYILRCVEVVKIISIKKR